MSIEQFYFTDCPRGEGIDPIQSGYQFKACSPGLKTNYLIDLSNLCFHYLKVLYSHQEAFVEENKWMHENEGQLDAIPQEKIDLFPVIWSYFPLKDDLYALTRSCYIGLTHDGRPGNRFSHGLVFDPVSLDAVKANPATLVRSSYFKSNDTSKSNKLESVEDISPLLESVESNPIPVGTVIGGQTASLVACLMKSRTENRAVVLTLPDWKNTIYHIEHLLQLLPPGKRSTVSFCSYESNLGWKLPGFSGKSTTAHDLVIQCGTDKNDFHFSPNDYEAKYYVFNYLANRHSEVQNPGPFANLVASAQHQKDVLNSIHDWIVLLGLGKDPDAWDVIADNFKHLTSDASPSSMANAVEQLSEYLKEPGQIHLILRTLMEKLHSLVKAGDNEGTIAIASKMEELLNRSPAEERQLKAPIPAELFQMALQCMEEERMILSSSLLRAFPERGKNIQSHLIGHYLDAIDQGISFPSQREEVEKMIALFLQSCPNGAPLDTHSSNIIRMSIVSFKAAQLVGLLPYTWDKMGEAWIKPLVKEVDVSVSLPMLQSLQDILSHGNCPEAHLWISLQILEKSERDENSFKDEIVSLCQRFSDRSAMMEILKSVEATITSPLSVTHFLGRIVHETNAFQEKEAWYALFYQRLTGAAQGVKEILQRLEQDGYHSLVSRVILDLFLPENRDSYPSSPLPLSNDQVQLMNELKPLIIQHSVHPSLCKGLTEIIRRNQLSSVQFLAFELLNIPEVAPGVEAMALADALLLRINLLHAIEHPVKLPESIKSQVSSKAVNRLEIVDFLVDLQTRGEQRQTNSLSKEDAEYRFWEQKVWTKNIAGLQQPEKREVVHWCLERRLSKPLTTHDSLMELNLMLQGVGMATVDEIVFWLDRLRQEKSPQDRADLLSLLLDFIQRGEKKPWFELLRYMIGQSKYNALLIFNDKLEALTDEPLKPGKAASPKTEKKKHGQKKQEGSNPKKEIVENQPVDLRQLNSQITQETPLEIIRIDTHNMMKKTKPLLHKDTFKGISGMVKGLKGFWKKGPKGSEK